MKLATVHVEGSLRVARVTDEATFLLPYSDVGALLADVSDLHDIADRGVRGPRLEEARVAPLVPRPGKVICVGLNYRTHITEMGREAPTSPTLFGKFSEALIGANDEIILPAGSEMMDWEAELAVVIGHSVRHASRREALDAIGGYTVANDVTSRDYQRRTSQWLQGKTFESTTPLGPVLVTPDEVDHARDLQISCTVDDQVHQTSRTSDLLFAPADLVAYVSEILTLNPGDVLLTGTPGGVGAGMQPPSFLKDGAVVITSIEGIGSCVNRCVGSSAHSSVSPQGVVV